MPRFGTVVGYHYDHAQYCADCWHTGTIPSEEELEAHGGVYLYGQDDEALTGSVCEQCGQVYLDGEWREDVEWTTCPTCNGRMLRQPTELGYQCTSCGVYLEPAGWAETAEEGAPVICTACHPQYLDELKKDHIPLKREQVACGHLCPECGKTWSGDVWMPDQS